MHASHVSRGCHEGEVGVGGGGGGWGGGAICGLSSGREEEEACVVVVVVSLVPGCQASACRPASINGSPTCCWLKKQKQKQQQHFTQ